MGNTCVDVSLNRRSFAAAAVGLLAAAPLGAWAQAEPVAATGTPDAPLNARIEDNARSGSIRQGATRHAVASGMRGR
jgi:hypothetical protein